MRKIFIVKLFLKFSMHLEKFKIAVIVRFELNFSGNYIHFCYLKLYIFQTENSGLVLHSHVNVVYYLLLICPRIKIFYAQKIVFGSFQITF